MENLGQYIRRIGQDDWEKSPAGELDFAAFSQIVYLPLDMALKGDEAISLKEVAFLMKDLTVDSLFSIYYKKRLELMREMAALPRYAGLLLSDYVHEVSAEDQKQFCAVCISIPGNIKALCFEGTDLSLAGWKEDFNMSFESPVPAQKDACLYLERLSDHYESCGFVLLGHSKGGNLSIYAAAFTDDLIKQRLQAVYSFDGPGLIDRDTHSPGYQAVSERIFAFLPQNSLVGVLMCRHEPSIIVKSGAFGVFQHDLFTWKIKKDETKFLRTEGLSSLARLRDEVFNDWLADVSFEDREKFSDALYQVLSADESREHVGDLIRPNFEAASRSLKALQDIDPTTRKMIRRLLQALFSETVETVVEAAKDAVKDIQSKVKEKFNPPPLQD